MKLKQVLTLLAFIINFKINAQVLMIKEVPRAVYVTETEYTIVYNKTKNTTWNNKDYKTYSNNISSPYYNHNPLFIVSTTPNGTATTFKLSGSFNMSSMRNTILMYPIELEWDHDYYASSNSYEFWCEDSSSNLINNTTLFIFKVKK